MNNLEQNRFFSRELLAWYMRNRRDLPWRRHRDPYLIWVSEIMLQQTRVDTVIPYFNRFVARFPTVQALAEASEEDVLKHWEGLGYYSRARNLQQAARQVVELHGGRIPDDRRAVAALKGVGPYTTGAIMSIAFNRPEPAVDGNVMRVLSRYFLIEEDIMKGSTRVGMEERVRDLIPEDRAADFNQALMELGALVCTPKSPHCLTCAVMEHCSGRLAGKEETLPLKTKARKPRQEQRFVALIEGQGARTGRVLVRQRPATGLLARMWELPHVTSSPSGTADAIPDGPAMNRLAGALKDEGIPVSPVGFLREAEHTFSHIHWNLRVFRCLEGAPEQSMVAESPAGYSTEAASAHGEADGGDVRWIQRGDMETLAFPKVFLAILRYYFERKSE